MDFCLSPNIHFCLLGETAVILDEARDRYFQLTGEPAAALQSLARGRAAAATSLDRLADLNIIKRDQTDAREVRPTQCISPNSSLLESGAAPTKGNWLITAEISMRLASAVISLRQRGFQKTLRAAKMSAAGARQTDEGSIEEASLEFDEARRNIPLAPSCLRDSLALLAFLRRRGHTARLVIGVKLNPFGAHCWVQSGEMALNELLERARAYTPIRVV
ncbi:MAG: lasso peptide biosynthesis B2 protein [Parvularculaceae bacterium]